MKYDDRWNGTARVGTMAVSVVAVIVLTACAGSGPGSGAGGRALEAYKSKMDESQDFKVFGLKTAGRSTAAATGDMLIEASTARPYKVASAALHGLVDRSLPGAHEALKTAFQEKKGALKQLAALALGKSGDEESAAWLKQQIVEDPNSATAEVLVFVARSGDDAPVRDILASRIGSDDELTRDQAYAILGRIGGPWAVQLLYDGLDKEHGARRKEAISALGRAGDPGAVGRIKKFANTQGLVFATLEALGRLGGDAAIETLRKSIDHEESLVRLYAGAGLWKAGDEDAGREALTPFVTDPDPTLRLNLAEQLGALEGDAASEMLASMTVDEDPEIRAEAFRGLIRIGTPAQQQVFLDAVEDPDYQVQTIALECVGRWGGPDAVKPLNPLLDGQNPYVVIAAANAVLEIEDRVR